MQCYPYRQTTTQRKRIDIIRLELYTFRWSTHLSEPHANLVLGAFSTVLSNKKDKRKKTRQYTHSTKINMASFAYPTAVTLLHNCTVRNIRHSSIFLLQYYGLYPKSGSMRSSTPCGLRNRPRSAEFVAHGSVTTSSNPSSLSRTTAADGAIVYKCSRPLARLFRPFVKT